MAELTWKAHPLKDDAPRSYAVLVALLALSVLMNWAFGGWLWSMLAAAFLFSSLARYFLPTAYRLTAEGVEVRFLGRRVRRPWASFRNLYPHAMGVHLSPFARPSALDPFRGLFLRYAPGVGSQAEAFCRERIAK
jgi:hypothetical protein